MGLRGRAPDLGGGGMGGVRWERMLSLEDVRVVRCSPGKNTGVGCHFLLQCMKVISEREVTQSCPTPSDPMDYSLPGFSINGIFQTRVLEWSATAFSDSG